jgi:hypothetical protein
MYDDLGAKEEAVMKVLRSASLYLSDEKAIVAACYYNAAGIRYEQEDPIVVDCWKEDDSITEALRTALDRFSFRERNLRNHKKSDWPAYNASALRTISDFEETYFVVSVFASNEYAVLYDASVKPRGERNITLESTLFFGRHNSDVSRDINRLYEICSKWDLMLS